MKNFLKRILNLIKSWLKKTALPFIKTKWIQVGNLMIIFIAFIALNKNQIFEAIFIGVWLIVLVGYYIIWRFLGVSKLFKK